MKHRLPENPLERRMFDSQAETFGGTLQAIAAALTIWSKVMPQEGSFAGQCAIMANEIGALIERETDFANDVLRSVARPEKLPL
jgi:hypothetical protein